MFGNFLRSIDDYKYGIDLVKKNQVNKFYDYKNNSLPILENLNMYRKILRQEANHNSSTQREPLLVVSF